MTAGSRSVSHVYHISKSIPLTNFTFPPLFSSSPRRTPAIRPSDSVQLLREPSKSSSCPDLSSPAVAATHPSCALGFFVCRTLVCSLSQELKYERNEAHQAHRSSSSRVPARHGYHLVSLRCSMRGWGIENRTW